MSDNIKLVIEIPKDYYEALAKTEMIMTSPRSGKTFMSTIYSAVAHGTPLSKGHGRILDEKDILDTENNDGGWYDLVDMPEYIAGVKAIIEADKESEG